MDCFQPSIPHLVVSSKLTIGGDLQLHVLTPFGQVDISVSPAPPSGDEKSCLDIRVEGSTADWMLEEALPSSFQETIIGFMGGIALRHSGWLEDRPHELRIHLVHETGDIYLAGCLRPCVSAIADG